MVAAILSRITIVLAGILYPAYSSFKAVRRKSHRDYTKWMMYWIVFAIFLSVEVLTDTFLAWLPLYYEVKILFVLWLVLPITEGSKQLYRYAIHPFLLKHEVEIDHFLSKAGETGMSAIRRFSRAGINIAATTMVSSAMKGQAVLTETLLRAQEQQRANVDSDQPDDGEGSQRPSTASSNDSEPFEVIDANSVEFLRVPSDPGLGSGVSREALDIRSFSRGISHESPLDIRTLSHSSSRDSSSDVQIIYPQNPIKQEQTFTVDSTRRRQL